MMLERLELRYFKKHEHLDVVFADGLNGIVGKNYRGKSTILLGVLYCLGGSRMVPGTRIQTRGTNTGFKQRLWFNVSGKGRYLVERTKTSANLHKLEPVGSGLATHDKVLMASGTTPVNNAIAELLGMPLRRFAEIKFARQKAADAILKYNSTELFKIVTEITGLERIGKVLDRLSTDLTVQRRLVEMMPEYDLREKQAELEQTQVLLAEAGRTRDTVSREVADLKAEITKLRERRDVLVKAVTAMHDASREVRHCSQLQQVADERLNTLGQRLNDLREQARGISGDVELDGAFLSELSDRCRNLKEEERRARGLVAEVASLAREVEGLGAHEQKLRNEAEKAEKVLHKLGAAPDQLDEVRAGLEQAKQRKAKAVDALEHASHLLEKGSCPKCLRAYDDFNLEDAREQLAQAADELEHAKGGLAAWAGRLLTAEAFFKQQQAAEAEVKRTALALRDFASYAENTGRALRLKQAEAAECRDVEWLVKELAQAERLRDDGKHVLGELNRLLPEYTEAVSKADEAKSKAEQALKRQAQVQQQSGAASAQELAGQLEELEVDLRDIAEPKLTEAGLALEGCVQTCNELLTKTKLLERDIDASAKSNADRERAARMALSLERLQQFIRNNRDRYSKQVWDVFMASASQFASTVTGGVIESLSRSDTGAFTFVEDGYEMALEEGSGAQLAIIGCAVQMALADAAQSPLNILLMDEPTADMDPEHALAFSTLLAASGRQVVMVTHREMDSAVFDHSIAL